MSKSKYNNRAKLIHGEKFIDQEEIERKSMEQVWNQEVRNKEGVVKFYKTYYPHLPDILVSALATYFDRMISGEVPLSEQFYRHSETNEKLKEQIWDYTEELNAQRNEGLINLTTKNLEQLLLDEEEEDKKKTKKNKK